MVNDRDELLAFCLMPGNVDVRRPVPRLVTDLFGDRGYISQELAKHLLLSQGLHVITKLKKNLRNRLLDATDKVLLRKRAIIETINDQRENICETLSHSASQPDQLPGQLPGQPRLRPDCLLPPA